MCAIYLSAHRHLVCSRAADPIDFLDYLIKNDYKKLVPCQGKTGCVDIQLVLKLFYRSL